MSTKVYEIITEKIIDKLKQGEIPWHKPWTGGYPKNLISKKEYKWINVFLLGCQRHSSPYWVSYKQAQELGGNVKKGEKSTIIVFWKQIKIKEKNENDEDTIEKTIPMLRYYRVFNIDQCENILPEKIPTTDINPDFQPITECEKTVTDMQNRPDIYCREQRAYYHPSDDFVNMPKPETFENEEFYYSVLFHELGHSTGHEKRLNRKKFAEGCFGSENYSKEELVAEMGAAFLCGNNRIENKTLDNSSAYIAGWLKRLRNDKKLLIIAAAQAEKAANFILNVN